MNQTELISRFGMKPHREGGFFAETDCGEKPESSHIYYYLPRGEKSVWHRIPNRELWLWHSGGTVILRLGGTEESPETTAAFELNQDNPCVAVPPDTWQTAIAKDDDTLVSCVCIPGYCDETNEIFKQD